MIEIIPAIIAQNFEEVEEKMKKVEPYASRVQLDVMDGKLVGNSTWNNPKELKNLKTGVSLEAHLMVEKPEEVIDDWIDSPAKRLIVHFESSRKLDEVMEKVKLAGKEIGLAINPLTPVEVLDEYIPALDLVLIMTVEPGKGGQELIGDTLAKIRKLRQSYPKIKIEVDGGINPKTAPEVVSAGANYLVVGSAIFDSKNIEETINKLKLCR